LNSDSFFEEINSHYESNLPFVVYSRPNTSVIKCWLQNDESIYKSSTFSESGFIFAPFNLDQNAILFPKTNCAYSEIISNGFIDNTKPEGNQNEDLESKAAHIKLVSDGISKIKSSHLKKIVLSRCKIHKIESVKPLETFKKLFNTYKNAMVYCWFHPKVGLWLGATPELLFKVEGKRLTTISLAGTQPLDNNDTVNWTPKEIDEQQMVTDYIHENLKPFANYFNISETETVRAGNLAHLKTRITSLVEGELILKEIIEALHPTPAVCGLPKQEAKDFILANENYNRDYYTGFLGELNLNEKQSRNKNRRNVENNAYSAVKKQSNFYVNLRCVQFVNSDAYIYIGGGITKDSNPENEWEETVNKAKTIENILG